MIGSSRISSQSRNPFDARVPAPYKGRVNRIVLVPTGPPNKNPPRNLDKLITWAYHERAVYLESKQWLTRHALADWIPHKPRKYREEAIKIIASLEDAFVSDYYRGIFND